jgi:LemA protein
VIKARAAAVASNGDARAQARDENVLVDALKQMLVLREAYPDLKANAQFLDLQAQLVTTEDRIQAARRLYNANVRDYNTRVQSFPSALVAKTGSFAKAEFFELEPAIRDAGAPEVRL